MSKSGIEVFQDMALASTAGDLPAVRAALINRQTPNWVHDSDQEAELRKYSGGEEDIVQFRYVGSALPRASLTLWQRKNEYSVTNIVPAEQGQLAVSVYNSLLQDFVDQLVKPAQSDVQFDLRLSDPVRKIDSWISAEAAEALRRFSVLANKSSFGDRTAAIFQGAYDAAVAIWGSLPGAIGDFAFQAANGLISGVEAMLNGVVTRINNFINGLNAALFVAALCAAASRGDRP